MDRLRQSIVHNNDNDDDDDDDNIGGRTSAWRSPEDPDLESRSLPARSTRFSWCAINQWIDRWRQSIARMVEAYNNNDHIGHVP